MVFTRSPRRISFETESTITVALLFFVLITSAFPSVSGGSLNLFFLNGSFTFSLNGGIGHTCYLQAPEDFNIFPRVFPGQGMVYLFTLFKKREAVTDVYLEGFFERNVYRVLIMQVFFFLIL